MRRQTIVLLILASVALAGGFILRSQHSARYPGMLHAQIEANLRTEYEAIDNEAAQLLKDSVRITATAWDEASHFFIYADRSGIVAWNRNQYAPEASSWSGIDTIAFVSSQRGDFLVKKWTLENGALVNILSLKDRYPITNSFLSPQLNESIFPGKEADLVSPFGTAGDPVRVGGRVAFRMQREGVEPRDSIWSFTAFIIGLVLLLAALFRLCQDIESKLGPDVSLLVVLASLYGIRSAMVSIGLPALFVRADIFDPKIFASSPLNASMGDLFLNGFCVFIVVLYLFRNFSHIWVVRWLLQQSSYSRFAAGVTCLLLAFFAVLFSFNFIEVVYHNSTQTLDITQSLTLNWVRITAFLSILMGTISGFLFIHVLVALARHLLTGGLLAFAGALLVAAGFFAAQYTVSGNDNRISLATGLAFFLMLRISNFDKLEFKFSFRFFIYLICSLTVFSIHHSLAVRMFHTERQVQDQFRYAKNFLTERDVLGEYLLDQARERIQQDQFIKTRMASPFFTKTAVVDKVKRVHLNSYFDRYELEVVTRNYTDTANQAGVESGVVERSFLPTGYQGITYSGASTGDAVRRYFVTIPIFYQRAVGSVELSLSLKRVVPENVFPELLVDNRFNQIYRNKEFSYAIFSQDRLVNSFGAFNYEKDFQRRNLGDPALYREGIEEQSNFHVGIDEADGSVAIVTTPVYSLSAFITNVSFWFVLGLAVLLVVQGIFGGVALFSGQQFAYIARIQLFMFLTFALPVVAVSVTILTLMGRSSEEATTQEFLTRSISTSQRIATLFTANSTLEPANLESWIVENAAYSKTDISVYSPDGKLLATSQPALFESQLLSNRMNREALQRIAIHGERQAVTDEQIGTLQYRCAYAAVLSPQSGRMEAVVSLPFFESAIYLQKGQILILSNILIVFVMVFLVFSLLSFLAAGNLTYPIRFITKKLRQTTFNGDNKPLAWNTSDEIGLLVAGYNRMVQNLEDSKRALARSEKEAAWREMAQQVAHEIKNPLTPMKLTLQQMEQGLRTGDFVLERTQKSVDVLLKQVEILNAIASSFSTFARMPAPNPQRLDLVNLLSETANLFNTGEGAEVVLESPAYPVWVSIDATSFSRALSNILINSIQAKPLDNDVNVRITVSQIGDKVQVAIHDNGRGIPAELQERIFQPQFTTKKSGSGLGLAMARQIVIQAGGHIHFKSIEDRGTTFFIELPLTS